MPLKPSLARLLHRVPLLSRALALGALGRSGYLRDQGWFRSRAAGLPVDAAGAPLPWYTYPAIAFLAPRLDPRLQVFEYGSGHSTLWWSARVAAVTSCEHDAVWHARLRPLLPANVTFAHVGLTPLETYASYAARYPGRFGLVVLDGRERVACARHALPALAPGGVILWDNSDRESYAEGFAFLRGQGFRRLDFWGPGPVNTYGWCTSVFYRTDNVLGV